MQRDTSGQKSCAHLHTHQAVSHPPAVDGPLQHPRRAAFHLRKGVAAAAASTTTHFLFIRFASGGQFRTGGGGRRRRDSGPGKGGGQTGNLGRVDWVAVGALDSLSKPAGAGVDALLSSSTREGG
jgi:hypothetical protein